jgi:hypothetical protein
MDPMTSSRSLAALMTTFAATLALAGAAHAHGTINGLGQSAEHEKLTRAATVCAPGFRTANVPGRCFEQASEDQLAGTSTTIAGQRIKLPARFQFIPTAVVANLLSLPTLKPGTVGAVGAPDVESFFEDTPHCTGGDYFNVAGYPQTRAQADEALMRCHRALQRHFQFAIDYADQLVDRSGVINPAAVKLPCDPIDTQLALRGLSRYVREVERRKLADYRLISRDLRTFISMTEYVYRADKQETAKCKVIGQIGRMMHGMQDFYSHGNWADQADPTKPLSVSNPPGLNQSGRAPLMDMLTDDPVIDPQLATACFDFPGSGDCTGRIDHDKDLGKDKGDISFTYAYPLPNKVTAGVGRTPRGAIGQNFAKAAIGAVNESTGAWTDLGTELIKRYGTTRGTQMICAITHDDPVRDCQLLELNVTTTIGPLTITDGDPVPTGSSTGTAVVVE